MPALDIEPVHRPATRAADYEPERIYQQKQTVHGRPWRVLLSGEIPSGDFSVWIDLVQVGSYSSLIPLTQVPVGPAGGWRRRFLPFLLPQALPKENGGRRDHATCLAGQKTLLADLVSLSDDCPAQ